MAQWRLLVEFGAGDIKVATLDTLVGQKGASEAPGGREYRFPDKSSVQEAKRRLKGRYRARIHCEVVPA